VILPFYFVVCMVKLRLFVRVREQGSYIASVPLKRLVELSDKTVYRKTRWFYEDGWLVLEAF
jgi:hypothetical protein